MKNILLLIVVFLSVAASSQKDTLAKYSEEELLKKGFVSPLSIYSEAALKRTRSDSVKVEALFELGYHYTLVACDDEIALQYFKRCANLAKKIGYKKYFYNSLSEICISSISLGKNAAVLSTLKEMQAYKNDPEYDLYTDEGDIYFLLGDFEKSTLLTKHKLEKLENELTKNNLSEERIEWLHKTCFWMQQNLVSNYSYQKKLDSAVFYLQESKRHDFYNFINEGRVWSREVFIWILKKKPDRALKIMEYHKKRINKYSYETFISFYYKALCYQQKGDYQKALKFSKDAIRNKETSYSYQNYELECYKIAADCSEKLGKKDEAGVYSKKYLELSQKINYAQKAAFIAKLYEQNEVNPLKKDLDEKTSNTKILYWGLSLACIFAIYLIFNALKSKREKKKFLAIIERLESKNSINTEKKPIEVSVVEDIIEKESIIKTNISEETENKILKSLEDFEKKKRFLEPGVSLGTISSEFQTNTTYITYVISKHKNDNLINYINKLRIDYIIRKITHDPAYSKYKVEYLAQECGFSSYLTFKRVFHKETGMNPSKFIGYLNEASI